MSVMLCVSISLVLLLIDGNDIRRGKQWSAQQQQQQQQHYGQSYSTTTTTVREGASNKKKALVMYHLHIVPKPSCDNNIINNTDGNATINYSSTNGGSDGLQQQHASYEMKNIVWFLTHGGIIHGPTDVFPGGVDYIFVDPTSSKSSADPVEVINVPPTTTTATNNAASLPYVRVVRTGIFSADLQGFARVADEFAIAEKWSEMYSRIIVLNSGAWGPLWDTGGAGGGAARPPYWVDLVSGSNLVKSVVIASSVSWSPRFHAQTFFLSYPTATALRFFRDVCPSTAHFANKWELILACEVDGVMRLSQHSVRRRSSSATEQETRPDEGEEVVTGVYELSRRVLVTSSSIPLNRVTTYTEPLHVNPGQALFMKRGGREVERQAKNVRRWIALMEESGAVTKASLPMERFLYTYIMNGRLHHRREKASGTDCVGDSDHRSPSGYWVRYVTAMFGTIGVVSVLWVLIVLVTGSTRQQYSSCIAYT